MTATRPMAGARPVTSCVFPPPEDAAEYRLRSRCDATFHALGRRLRYRTYRAPDRVLDRCGRRALHRIDLRLPVLHLHLDAPVAERPMNAHGELAGLGVLHYRARLRDDERPTPPVRRAALALLLLLEELVEGAPECVSKNTIDLGGVLLRGPAGRPKPKASRVAAEPAPAVEATRLPGALPSPEAAPAAGLRNRLQCGRDLFELGRVSTRLVRVVAQRHLPVGPLDLVRRGSALDA
mmetsp:Transcript_13015/g.30593  ORF Transcript_13015/g.30593 Transcript_13015/m.30593 type:complete len:237 (-) Transcript_13015:273-983(-)